eukprot:GHVU01171409.1.p1 GENE.GHVU01171409.1~~GHVU01171409.1.p1  ORF type:complete len:617 (+),score=69.30 GHVU01171409.1:1998-3848(+)
METIDLDSGRLWHARLGDPCPTRLRATLAEQGLTLSRNHAQAIRDECGICDVKNAVHHAVPRSLNRSDRASKFNDEVAADLLYMTVLGVQGERHVSVFVDVATHWLELKSLKQRSEVAVHLHEWVSKNNPMQALRTDCARELTEGRSKEICAVNNIRPLTVPPYTSKANGVAEHANRDVRSMIGTALIRLGLEEKFWPIILTGIQAKHNSSAGTLTASPFLRRYGFPPKLDFLLGDQVYLKLPAPATAPKPVGLPGVMALYCGPAEPASAIVYCPTKKPNPVVRVHSSSIKHARGGSHAIWLERFTNQQAGSLPQPCMKAAAPPTKHLLSDLPQCPTCTGEDSEDSEGQSLPVRASVVAARGAPSGPVPAMLEAGAAIEAPVENAGGEPAIAPVENAGGEPAIEESGDDSVGVQGSEHSLLPRSGRPRVGQGLLVYDDDSLLRAAVVVESHPSTSQIGWLQEENDGRWTPQHLTDVRNADIEAAFHWDGARVPQDAVARVGERWTPGRPGTWTSDSSAEEEVHITEPTPDDRARAGAKHSPAPRADVQQGLYEEAKMREVIRFVRKGVFGNKVDRDSTTMEMIWITTEKRDPITGAVTRRARWVARGYQVQQPVRD